MSDYIEFKIGTSTYKNAGICGFVYMLENSGAVENEDYEIGPYSLKVRKDYMDAFDIADAYIKAHIKKFKDSIALYRIINSLKVMGKEETTEDDLPKSFKDIQKRISEFSKNRYKAALDNLSETNEENAKIVVEIEELIEWISKNKKVYNAEKMLKLSELLETDDVFEYLGMADIKLQIPAFWTGVAFLNRNFYKKDTRKVYREYFEDRFRAYIDNEKGTRTCVECGQPTEDIFNIGFIGAVKDSGRKRSYFWNLEEDASVCPICALLYTLMPLGFTHIGEDFMFINANTNLPDLIRINRKREAIVEEKDKLKVYLYKHITLATLESYESCPGIQIDLRTAIGTGDGKDYNREQLLIDSNMIQLFHSCKNNFEHLFTKIVKTKDGYYNVYDNLINSLFSHMSLYYMIDFLYNEGLRAGTKTNYLLDLLDIQMNRKDNKRKGDKNLDSQDMKNKAYYYGKDMRNTLLNGSSEKDLENKLRGRLYSLSNAVRTGNYKQFTDIIINIYSSTGKQIPKLFIDCIDNRDVLDIVGRAYLIGLKSFDMDTNKEGE